ncbi:MAG: hypothetical protein ABSD28_12340 [Tepidisphaeraceae bacterium]|jgi:hypothetical protein
MESFPATTSETPVVEPSADSPQRTSGRRWRVYALRSIGWLLIALVLALSIRQGLRLRRWVFDIADPIRFTDDTSRGVYWGLVASGPEGFLNQYDKMDPQVPEWQNSLWVPWLDYGPLRLLVMDQWGAWIRANHPPEPGDWDSEWQRPYEFNRPVLWFNTVLEGIAAICAFFLTWLWVLRGSAGEERGHFHGVWQGVVAALCIWFSLDILISAHAWFQWDSWVVPCYLAACLLASLDWWFAAGVAVAIGVNFKGQMLSISPIFVIWPLVQGRYGGALRWICGMGLGMAAIASGWLVSYIPPDRLAALQDIQAGMSVAQYPPDLFAVPRKFDVPAAIWLFEMLIAAATVPWLLRILMPAPAEPSSSRWKAILRSRWTWIAAAAIFIAAMVYWPWLLPQNRSSWHLGLLAGLAVAASALLLRPRNMPYLLAAVAAGGLLSCIGLFHGGTGWWDCSITYGSIHWPYMVTGPASNLPAIFQLRFGWDRSVDQIAFTLPAMHGHWPGFVAAKSWWPAANLDVTAKMLFDSIYGVMLVLSGIAIGLQARRNDRRMLVALVTPWIMFFLFPVQIQERYLLYASGAAACCIGDSVGMALLGFSLTLFSAIMHTVRMLDWHTADLAGFGQNLSRAFPRIFSPESGQTMLQYLQAMHPDMGWGILTVGMIFLYLSFMPSRGSRKRRLQLEPKLAAPIRGDSYDVPLENPKACSA